MTEREGRFERRMEQDWREFRQRLADRLADMDDGELLFVDAHSGVQGEALDGATPYVQFRADGRGVLHAEAVGNAHLASAHTLTPAQEAALVGLGWVAPRSDEEEETSGGNFHVEVPVGHADRLAVMAVRALREVHGCVHPALLDAGGLEPAAPVPAPPERGDSPASIADTATYPRDREELAEVVDAALEELFDSPAEHDDDGDVPIVCGQSVVFVRVRDDRPAVELFAELVLGVTDPAIVLPELDRLNRRDVDRHYFVRGESVVARQVLVAWPVVPGQVRSCTRIFCDGLDDVAAELVQQVGGRRFLDPAPEPTPEPGPAPSADLAAAPEVDHEPSAALRGLLEVMHVGHVPAASVAALFDDDRAELLRSVEVVRAGGVDDLLDDLVGDAVLDRLRRGLRVVVDRQARGARGRGDARGDGSATDPTGRSATGRHRSQQLSLHADDEPVQEDLWGEVS